MLDNFAMVAPYSKGSRSFYEEPRKKLIQFVEWVCSEEGRRSGCPDVDPKRIILFGFSDGATAGIELMTTRRFAGGVFAAYGFTGDLPALAAERLQDLPIWVFHSADDVIFPVKCSDKLVKRLREVGTRDVVRYTRYDQDQEGFTGSVRGHSEWGGDAVGKPHRAQFSKFDLFELVVLLIINIRRTVPCRAIRGHSVSVDSTLPPS